MTQVKYLDEMSSLCSSSLDKTLALYDVERRSPVRTLVGHTKGVYRWARILCPLAPPHTGGACPSHVVHARRARHMRPVILMSTVHHRMYCLSASPTTNQHTTRNISHK